MLYAHAIFGNDEPDLFPVVQRYVGCHSNLNNAFSQKVAPCEIAVSKI